MGFVIIDSVNGHNLIVHKIGKYLLSFFVLQ